WGFSPRTTDGGRVSRAGGPGGPARGGRRSCGAVHGSGDCRRRPGPGSRGMQGTGETGPCQKRARVIPGGTVQGKRKKAGPATWRVPGGRASARRLQVSQVAGGTRSLTPVDTRGQGRRGRLVSPEMEKPLENKGFRHLLAVRGFGPAGQQPA